MNLADLSKLDITLSPELQEKIGSREVIRGEINAAEGDIKQLSPTLQKLHGVMPDGLDFGNYAYEVFDIAPLVVESFDGGDWDAYISTHPQNLRLSAFLTLVPNLEDVDYWRLLKSVYTDDDHISLNGELYRDLYNLDC